MKKSSKKRYGYSKRYECLMTQTSLCCDARVIRYLCEHGEERIVKKGKTIIQQGEMKDSIFFILQGSVNIIINKRQIAVRHQGQHIGEMAMLDPSAKRSATVVTREECRLLEVSAEHMKVCMTNQISNRIACEIIRRLSERNDKIVPPNETPVVFLGSSTEAKSIVDNLDSQINHLAKVETRRWDKNVFTASETSIESLEKRAAECDFAVFVFSMDDKVESREKTLMAPRDNVIFELGLFCGKLDRKRVMVVLDGDFSFKNPSDLDGVTYLLYGQSKEDHERCAAKITQCINELGVK